MSILGYETLSDARRGFAWEQRWSLFDGDSEYFNLAHECLVRHLHRGEGRPGLRIVRSDGTCEVVSMGELDALANRIGNVLRRHGVAMGDRVAVRLEPSREFVAAMFASLKLGAVFVPCTPLLGDGAIASRIADAVPVVTLVESKSDISGDVPAGHVIDRSTLATETRRADAILAVARTRAEDPAIYIYSSGTTGRPKRTVLQHQGFTYLTVIVGKFVLDLRADDCYVACYTPGYLGGFGWGILVPMALGTAAGIYAGRFDAKALVAAIRSERINALHCPPTAYRKILSALAGEKLAIGKLAYTAEAMDAALAERVRGALGGYARGHYGATEIGMVAVDYAFSDYSVRPGAIGMPILATEIVVVDDQLERQATGVVGRVALVRRGKTLHSGDFGMFDVDGYLWYRGRANDVIISGGHTISALEIEEAIARHPVVEHVAVVAVDDDERGAVPKAFVQPAGGIASIGDPDALREELRNIVRHTLGRYAYPREIVFLDEFERNEAGKIIKATLTS